MSTLFLGLSWPDLVHTTWLALQLAVIQTFFEILFSLVVVFFVFKYLSKSPWILALLGLQRIQPPPPVLPFLPVGHDLSKIIMTVKADGVHLVQVSVKKWMDRTKKFGGLCSITSNEIHGKISIYFSEEE